MPDLEYYPLMATYNQWMNQQIYRVCAQISDLDRKLQRGAFFGSIHGTLNHLLLGDKIWMGRFTGQPCPAAVAEDLHTNFEALHQERQQMDHAILNWASTLTSEWLSQPFSWTSALDGQTRTQPAWILVVHLFNHETHHRGQLTTLLSQMGLDYGKTDIPWMPSLTPPI